MAAGVWSVRLVPETPQTVLAKLDLRKPGVGFGHFIFTPREIPVDRMSDFSIREVARYSGIYRSRPEEFEFGGPGVNAWMGDEDGKGPVLSTPTGAASPYGWDNWVPVMQHPQLFQGIRAPVSVVGGTYQKTFTRVAFREMVDDVCARFGTEWRVQSRLWCDLARREDIYRMDPVAVVMRRPQDVGNDLNPLGIVGAIDLEQDLEDWTRRVLYYTGTDAAPTLDIADGGVSVLQVPYRGPFGEAIDMDRVIEDFSTTPTTSGAALAAMQYGRFDSAHEEIKLGSIEYDIGPRVKVGDNIWVYDPRRGIVDLNNPIQYRGSQIYPEVIRCVGHTWPIKNGMGVYFRRYIPGGSTWAIEYVDLTPFIDWESGGSTVDIGSVPRPSQAT